jgi:hypothetical protein
MVVNVWSGDAPWVRTRREVSPPSGAHRPPSALTRTGIDFAAGTLLFSS